MSDQVNQVNTPNANMSMLVHLNFFYFLKSGLRMDLAVAVVWQLPDRDWTDYLSYCFPRSWDEMIITSLSVVSRDWLSPQFQ